MDQRAPMPMQRGGMYVMRGDGPHGGGDTLEWVIFALLLLLIVLVIALLVLTVVRRPPFGGGPRRGLHGPPGGGKPWGRPDPLSIAGMRYARGDIGRDEYVRLAEDLGGEAEPDPAKTSG